MNVAVIRRGTWTTFVTYESHAELVELRRLVKRRHPRATVRALEDHVSSAAERIIELELAELREHADVLWAL